MEQSDSKAHDDEYNPKDLKDVLAHDYKIPGISRQFYLPLSLLILGVVIAIAWGGTWPVDDLIFLSGLLVLIVISATSVAIQGLIKRSRRR